MTAPRRISIRELHEHTGTRVREAAAAGYAVVVTDRGRPVATLAPYVERDARRTFRERVPLPEFAAFKRRIVGDASVGIADDRSRF